MILLPYLDCFIVIQNSQSLPGLGTVRTTHCDTTTLCHLPRLAKKHYVTLKRVTLFQNETLLKSNKYDTTLDLYWFSILD
jgi:hypothetical protein